jgi:biotin carboxyl carrier protein
MTFEIELNGHTRRVSIERAGAEPGRFRVDVDGTTKVVDARRVGEFGISLLFPGDSHAGTAIELAPGTSPGEVLAHLGGRTIPIIVNGRRGGRRGAEAGGAAAHGEQKITAPMPGRVVRVLVLEGEEVAARQPVVVVEAMKMENELRSPKAGRVKSVTVEAGTSVEAGRVLVVIE